MNNGLIELKSLHYLSALVPKLVIRTYLSLDGVTTLLTEIHEIQDGASDVSQSSNRLHLNSVHLLQRVVQDTGGVDNLPSQVLVVHVSDKERLCGESIRLDIDVGSSDLVDETTLADIGVTADQKCSSIRVDSGQTVHVLPDLFEVLEGLSLPLHDGGHSTESSSFKLFTSVERVSELDQADVVFGNLGDEVSSGVELSKSKLVVVLVV
jgi:hypothetical protein